jgi:hypothetical protein
MIPHISEMTQYLCFHVCFISWSIMSFGLIHVAENDRTFLLFEGWIVVHHVYMWIHTHTHMVFSFSIYKQTLRLLPYNSYCEWCCNAQVNANNHGESDFISLEYIPEVRLLDYMLILFLSFLRNSHTIFYIGYFILHSHPQPRKWKICTLKNCKTLKKSIVKDTNNWKGIPCP